MRCCNPLSLAEWPVKFLNTGMLTYLEFCRLVDIRSESGFTPLHFAVSASNAAAGTGRAAPALSLFSVVQHIVSPKTCDAHSPTLRVCLPRYSCQQFAAVRVLLERGACWSAEVLMGACYSIWPTRSIPLHIAAAKGSISVAKLLLQAQVGASETCSPWNHLGRASTRLQSVITS